MNKFLSYLTVLLVWSVGCAYAAYDKPANVSCMDWLEELETRRDRVAQQVTDDQNWHLHEESLWDLSGEISATIAGKYGISSTPATAEEREKILRSIDRNRQVCAPFPDSMERLYAFFEYEALSESRLRQIAQEKGIDFQVFQSHLAAIAVADGASFSLKVPGTAANSLTVKTVTDNILFTHDERYKEGLNRLLRTLPDAEKETLIQTLTRVEKTKTGSPLESDGFQKALADPIKTGIQEAFKFLLYNEDDQLFLKIFGRLGLGNADLCLDVISAKKAG